MKNPESSHWNPESKTANDLLTNQREIPIYNVILSILVDFVWVDYDTIVVFRYQHRAGRSYNSTKLSPISLRFDPTFQSLLLG